jgi:RecA-family ATPase
MWWKVYCRVAGFACWQANRKLAKSTLARQLAVAVAKGTPFLGRQTEQGGVIYLALEEKESEVAAHFKALGLSDTDPVETSCGAVPRGSAVANLEAALKAMPGTKLVIIDPVFRFVGGVKDSNDYVQVNNALEPLLTLARNYGVHIVIVHHMKKVATEDARMVCWVQLR